LEGVFDRGKSEESVCDSHTSQKKATKEDRQGLGPFKKNDEIYTVRKIV
jgi:hypothetical protein